MTKKLVQ